MKFQILRSGAEFYWKIVSDNGNVMAHSENYKNRVDAVTACLTVIKEAAEAQLVDLTQVPEKTEPAPKLGKRR